MTTDSFSRARDDISTSNIDAGSGTFDRLTDAEVRVAVSKANVPSLLMVIYQATGDDKWLSEPYLPTRGKGLGDHDSGGLAPEIQETIRAEAAEVILALQNGMTPAIETPTAEQTVRMMGVCMGEEVGPEYGPMLSLGTRPPCCAGCPTAGHGTG